MDFIITIGKGQSPSNNPKISMMITGNIVDPTDICASTKGNCKAHRIPVCAGTEVVVAVTDSSGDFPNNTSDSMTCDTGGCTGVVNVTTKWKSVSTDGKDTDRMTLLPK